MLCSLLGSNDHYLQGTALFMAGELLENMLEPDTESQKKVPAEIERGVHHDLESFILVLFYSAMKRGLERRLWQQDHSPIKALYHTEEPPYLFDAVFLFPIYVLL